MFSYKNEQGRKSHQPMHIHSKDYSFFNELCQFDSLQCDSKTVDIDVTEHLFNAVLNNCWIIDQNKNTITLMLLILKLMI